jgi:hypothetical protein
LGAVKGSIPALDWNMELESFGLGISHAARFEDTAVVSSFDISSPKFYLYLPWISYTYQWFIRPINLEE